MARKPAPQVALLFLLVLTLLSWGIVVGELALTGTVSIFAIANAAVFTLTLALWPLITGTRVSTKSIRLPEACRECGTLAMSVPGVKFCLSCGAYPKVAARASASPTQKGTQALPK